MTAGSVELVTTCPGGTMAMAESFAAVCLPDDVVALRGTLGAGKTCFVKGLAAGLGVEDTRRVVSPTFVLMRVYRGRLPLYHFDAYRLSDAEEMEETGCTETFRSGGVSVVEWAERVPECLPAEHFAVDIEIEARTRRRFHLAGVGPGPAERLGAMADALAPWRVSP